MVNVTTPGCSPSRSRALSAVALISAGVTTLGLMNSPAAAATASFRVLDTTVVETDGNTTVCTKVALSQEPKRRTTVRYSTADGTAKAPSDYVSKTGSLVFKKGGPRTKNACTTLEGDTLNEPTERFKIKLSSPSGASIADKVGVVTVNDNDTAPALTAGNAATVAEGHAGVKEMIFPVTLASPSARPVTVGYSFGPGAPAAASGLDFTVTPPSGTVTFAPGEQYKMLSVQVLGDTADEVDEQVALALANPVNATIADGSGAGVIKDDDGPGIAINNVSKNEGWLPNNLYTFTVSLSAPSPQPVSVAYSTANGTAASGGDFVAQSGTLTFLPGQTARAISVPVTGDLVVENHESFAINLGSPTNANITDAQGAGTILNDDAASFDEGRLAATYLGSMSGDTGAGQFTRSDSILLQDADWFRIRISEDNDDLFSSRDLTARITLLVGDAPAQTNGDLDMEIYRSNGTLVGRSTANGTADEQFDVKKHDVPFSTDHTEFYVKVFGFGGNKMNNYTLRVNGNVATGVAPNL